MPVIELMLLMEVGTHVGIWNTLGLCLLSGFIGASLARSQGAGVVSRIQGTLQRGGLPARELVDGVLILVAGVVLLTPGFVTDALGIILLLPPSRALVRALVFRWIQTRLREGRWEAHPGGASYNGTWGGGESREHGSSTSSVGAAEFIPPELAPRPPKPSPPDIIDA